MDENHMTHSVAGGELERLLRAGFESRGLACELETYGASEDSPVEELVVRNIQAPERGLVRIYADGSVIWEICRTLSAEGARPILDEVTNLLRRRPGQSPARDGHV